MRMRARGLAGVGVWISISIAGCGDEQANTPGKRVDAGPWGDSHIDAGPPAYTQDAGMDAAQESLEAGPGGMDAASMSDAADATKHDADPGRRDAAGGADAAGSDSGALDGAAGDASHEDGGVDAGDPASEIDDAGKDAGADAGEEHLFAAAYAVISDHCVFCHHPDRDGPGAGENAGIGYSLGHLDMSTAEKAYANLVGDGTGVVAAGIDCSPTATSEVYRRVGPGDPADSLIIDKLAVRPPECGVGMPDGLPQLDPTSIEVIAAWIRAGAPND